MTQAEGGFKSGLDAGADTVNFDPQAVRKDFPILWQSVNGHPLVYLDNGATTQKPQAVIDAISNYYSGYNSNVHRGAHTLSDKATSEFEHARQVVAQFIGSPTAEQVIWTRGATEAINLVAATWGRTCVNAGDVILVSNLEHHSNMVPWQMLALEKGAKVLAIPIADNGDILLAELTQLLANNRVKMVAVNHVSNALGTINPVDQIIELAHAAGATVLVDGAQAVAHLPLDLQALNCDFYAFSGHKLFGPTGIGVLWGKKGLLEAMPPYQGGGEMIETVSFEGTTYNTLPYKFEAGTPDIAGAIGLAAAVNYLSQFDRRDIAAHESDLLNYCQAQGCDIGLQRIGSPQHCAGVYSFLIPGVHPADVGMLLDQQGIAIRTGHHCAQPLMQRLNVPGTVRASFSIYNSKDDVDRLIAALKKAKTLLL